MPQLPCCLATDSTAGNMRKLSVGGTGPRSGRVCQAKRVAPPTVPDCGPSRHSGSSFASSASSSSTSASTASSSGGYGSVSSGWSSSDQRSSLGLDDSLPPPPSPGVIPPPLCKSMYREGEPIYSGRNLPSPSHAPIFTFPSNQNQVYGHLLSRSGSQPSSPHAKMDRDYSTSLLPHPSYLQQASVEDQGIDLTQSPGRESPSSSTGSSTGLKSSSSSSAGIGPGGTIILAGCRHSTTSTTSLDSGRASSYEHAHRHGSSSSSSASTSTSGLTRHQHRMSAGSQESCMRHSYHSSSSSLGSSAKSDDIHRLNVGDMLAQGVPEHEVLNAWLTDLGFEEYYDLFVQAGYDMHTITRMTPEDLTAIGIQKPNHRKKLKAELAQLNIPDGLPEFIPETLEEWLSLLGLAEYSPSLRRQGYRTVEDVTQLTWEDLEDFGILRLGHQKKILLAIKRVKDILAGKWVPPPALENCCYNAPDAAVPAGLAADQQHMQEISNLQYRASHYAVPPPVNSLRMPQAYSNQQPIYYQYKQPLYQPDVVAIQVHRNKSSEDLRPFSGHSQGQGHLLAQGSQTFYKPEWRQRSYEEGDISPISEVAAHSHPIAGGGTLPRPRGTVKPRPVAKISAKTRPDNEVVTDVYKTAGPNQGVNFQRNLSAGGLPQQQQYLYGTLTKRAPPLPPKRSVSSEEDVYGQLAKASPLPPPPPPPADSLSLLSYSEDSEDFPPPPAPITASDSYLQHGQAAAAASVRERLDNILQRSGAGHWPRPHPVYGPYGTNPINASRPTMPNSKNLPRDRECSPCESIETSDTEPGSPNADFRQRRNGSDASFKSTSSTESDSLPFANDNAGTIKQRSVRPHPGLPSLASYARSPAQVRRNVTNANHETSDVLNDIGNMLAGLTDELDAMLEEETKQKP